MSHRRKEAIRKSMSRPLRVEMGRTAFIVACILADLVLLPIAVEYAIGRYWLVAAPLLLLPICYLQLRVHHQWFVSPFDEAANEGGPTQVDT